MTEFILWLDPDIDEGDPVALLDFALASIRDTPNLAWKIVGDDGYVIAESVKGDGTVPPAKGQQWIAWPRADVPVIGEHFADQKAEEQLDWLLRAVTTEGSDVNQRRYDLEAIAALVTEHPQVGYGRMPVDTDVHGPECIICNGEEDFSLDPPGLSRDGHPYTEKVVPGQTLYVVDEDGATFAFLYKPHAERAAAQEFARGAIGLREFTIKAPREVVFWQEDGDNDVLVTLADYACSHGPDIKVKPEFEYLMTAVLETWSGSSREDFDQPGPSEYLRGQVELLLYAGALEAPDGYDNADAKDWLTSHIITRVLLDNQKGNA